MIRLLPSRCAIGLAFAWGAAAPAHALAVNVAKLAVPVPFTSLYNHTRHLPEASSLFQQAVMNISGVPVVHLAMASMRDGAVEENKATVADFVFGCSPGAHPKRSFAAQVEESEGRESYEAVARVWNAQGKPDIARVVRVWGDKSGHKARVYAAQWHSHGGAEKGQAFEAFMRLNSLLISGSDGFASVASSAAKIGESLSHALTTTRPSCVYMPSKEMVWGHRFGVTPEGLNKPGAGFRSIGGTDDEGREFNFLLGKKYAGPELKYVHRARLKNLGGVVGFVASKTDDQGRVESVRFMSHRGMQGDEALSEVRAVRTRLFTELGTPQSEVLETDYTARSGGGEQVITLTWNSAVLEYKIGSFMGDGPQSVNWSVTFVQP